MTVMIILNYNDSITTLEYISLIREYDSVDKIVIVDNHSNDGSFSRLEKVASEKVHVIRTPENKGYAFGNNFGINYALSVFGEIDIFIISNPDIIVGNSTISILKKTLKNNDSLFAVSPFIMNKNNQRVRNFAWRKLKYGYILLSCTPILQFAFRRFFHYSKFYSEDEIIDPVFNVDILPGCFFVVDASKWRMVGGFDENTFLYFEEDIVFSKANEFGFCNCVVTSSSLKHLESVSINKSINKFSAKERIYRNSCLYYMKKYMQLNELQLLLYKFMHFVFLPARFLISWLRLSLRRTS